MPVPDVIHTLIERFNDHRESYLSGRYNETQLRREFLDPLFESLGWDIYNRLGYAEAYKEVIHEDSLPVEGSTKAPDYCFRVGGSRKFFVEAKKPSVNLKEDVSPAFQIRRYAWSAGLPLSILTGAIFMILTDLLSRTVMAPTEIPIGVITAICGAPFFLYLLRRRKKAIF